MDKILRTHEQELHACSEVFTATLFLRNEIDLWSRQSVMGQIRQRMLENLYQIFSSHTMLMNRLNNYRQSWNANRRMMICFLIGCNTPVTRLNPLPAESRQVPSCTAHLLKHHAVSPFPSSPAVICYPRWNTLSHWSW